MIQLFAARHFTARLVCEDDAEFILALRLSERARFLKKTENSVDKQRQYIADSIVRFNRRREAYIIAENKDGARVACFRFTDLDNAEKMSFHSLVAVADIFPPVVLDMFFCIYEIFFAHFAVDKIEFPVPEKHRRIIALHKKMGIASARGRADGEICYWATRENFAKRKMFFKKLGFGIVNNNKFAEHFCPPQQRPPPVTVQ